MGAIVAAFQKPGAMARFVRLAWILALALMLADPDGSVKAHTVYPIPDDQAYAANVARVLPLEQGRPAPAGVGQATRVVFARTGDREVDEPVHEGFPLDNGRLSRVRQPTGARFERTTRVLLMQATGCPLAHMTFAPSAPHPAQVRVSSDAQAVEGDNDPDKDESNRSEFSLRQAVDTPTNTLAGAPTRTGATAPPPEKPPPNNRRTTTITLTSTRTFAPAADTPHLTDTPIPTGTLPPANAQANCSRTQDPATDPPPGAGPGERYEFARASGADRILSASLCTTQTGGSNDSDQALPIRL
jgi:hypothetical protein